MDAKETVLQFVAGKIDAKAFTDALYAEPLMEEFLGDPSVDWHGTFVGRSAANLHHYLLELDFSRTSDKMDALEALELFLEKKGIPYSKDTEAEARYGLLHDLMLDTEPSYLDVGYDFFEKHIAPADIKMPKAELKKTARENYGKFFKYQTKPPSWIQGPEWPVKGETPLFFVGQLQLKLNHEAFHDEGAVYVFLDIANGEIETVRQFY
ncbi:MAG: hypothetical protein FWG66_05375 [Spirochaetes bacterium]|nr:hypothetical protein [Spirochaetota bacterium]